MNGNPDPEDSPISPSPHRRRPRYGGKNPRRYDQKYKELNPEKYPDTVAKVIASGKTPAGSHLPIMVAEILEALDPQPGQTGVDATLGYGGHARALLARIVPGGRLYGFDADPLELPKTAARLKSAGYGEDVFTPVLRNHAGLASFLAQTEAAGGVDFVLADLGCSSMQYDEPGRGFSYKHDGPLDMRWNPSRGLPASTWIEKCPVERLEQVLLDNSDEPLAGVLARSLAGGRFETTHALAGAIRRLLKDKLDSEELERTLKRVFQAVRISVNDEFSSLESLLRILPDCLVPGGRVAILTFHSGEDRRVKKAFHAGLVANVYRAISRDPLRAGSVERHANPRAVPAKLRWAEKSRGE